MSGTSKEREAFPAFDDASSPHVKLDTSPTPSKTTHSRDRGPSASTVTDRLRRLSQNFEVSSVPGGFMAATGTFASDVISLSEEQKAIAKGTEGRSGSQSQPRSRALSPTGLQGESPGGPRNSLTEKPASGSLSSAPEESGRDPASTPNNKLTEESSADAAEVANHAPDQEHTEPFDNGYHFPPSYSALESTKYGLIAFWHYFLTPLGFFVVIYGLNVVAWGGMLFLLLCDASPAMCYGGCNNINSPRRIWIEVDSQILTALFSVTGFGLIPWRFRDLYYLLQYRIYKKQEGLRRLGGIHRGWYRLPGSEDLPIKLGPDAIESPEWQDSPAVPYPVTKVSDAPRTGTRAPATKMWKLDFVIWTMVGNTFLQGALSGCMWGLNRYNRPSWTTGFLVAMACIVAAAGGIMMFMEGKHVKSIEGVPLKDRDIKRLERDRVLGIPHYNNIKDKRPKEKEDVEAGTGQDL
jgi:hypothetical protein